MTQDTNAFSVIQRLSAASPKDDVLTVYQLAQAGVVAVDEYFERLIVTYDENGQGTIAYPCEDDDAAE